MIAIDLLKADKLQELERRSYSLLVSFSNPLHLLKTAGTGSLTGTGLIAVTIYCIGIFVTFLIVIGAGIFHIIGLDFNLEWFDRAFKLIYFNPVALTIQSHGIKFENRWIGILIGVAGSRLSFAVSKALSKQKESGFLYIVFFLSGLIFIYFFLGIWAIWILTCLLIGIISMCVLFPAITIILLSIVSVFKLGYFLKEKVGFRNFLPTTGVILMIFGLIIQFIIAV
ncbi:MAG: hypothetical protein PVG39_18365 [Desulfobacteraceae bacterium]